MKLNQITGVGPVQPDGSVELFTVLSHPYIATKLMLEQRNLAAIEIGDMVLEADDGSFTIRKEGDEALAGIQRDDAPPQPKPIPGIDVAPDGPAVGTATSHRYRSSFEVDAYQIVSVSDKPNDDGTYNIATKDGQNHQAAHIDGDGEQPVEGDYLVVMPEGDARIFSKDDFESDFALVLAPSTAEAQTQASSK